MFLFNTTSIKHPTTLFQVSQKKQYETTMERRFQILVLVVFIAFAIAFETVQSYNHAWYMRCCAGCNAMPAPQARAVCYASCMATAAAMPP